MQRYFLELAYKGTAYSGFQIQDTGVTIQSELTDALHTIFRTDFHLTGSSRTDAGVHAEQNYRKLKLRRDRLRLLRLGRRRLMRERLTRDLWLKSWPTIPARTQTRKPLPCSTTA